MIYFDTSVLAAYYTEEQRTGEAAEIIGKASLPVVSDLTIAELNVVIARKERLGFLPLGGAAAVFALFDEHLGDSFLSIAIEPRHIQATRDFAVRSPIPLRTLDTLHLVMASEVEGALATFDGRLADAARAMGFAVLP
ncbi:MAG TPA: type II toxin-antitoxin system VapC family toxin [Thermoanaerobaculia bacterium]